MLSIPTNVDVGSYCFNMNSMHMKNGHVYNTSFCPSILDHFRLMSPLTENENMCNLLQSITFWPMGSL
jgi:hypothetical protein